jgi:hypothetical protein
MQVPDTPPREAADISGVVGAVPKDGVVAVAAVVATERPARARSIRESSPLPWITAIAPR